MKKLSLIVIVAIMAFSANVFAQEATKPAGQEHAKTTEVKKEEMKKEGVSKTAVKKDKAMVAKKHHKKAKKDEKKGEAAPEKK